MSALAGTPCLAYSGYKKTLPANSRTLHVFCCTAQFVYFQRHTDDYRSYNLQERPLHVWGGAALPWQHTDGCLQSQISPVLETQEWHAAKIPLVFASLESVHSRSRSTAGTTDFVSDSFLVPLLSASRKWTVHENPIFQWCHWVGKVVAFFHTGDKEALVSPFYYHQLQIKNVIARNSGSIDQVMIVRTLSECGSRQQWRTDQNVQRCVKSVRWADDHLALLRRTQDVIETFAPLAEGALLGTSAGSACSGV